MPTCKPETPANEGIEPFCVALVPRFWRRYWYGGRYLGQRLLQLRSHSGTIQKIGGIIIISTAIAMLLGLVLSGGSQARN